jgi:phosphopantothenoylcysteine decarboxylase/phosphopantothenate--cysteine ligase
MGADAVVMAAAVADFRPADPKPEKIKKAAGEGAPDLALVRNPDLLAAIGATRAAVGAVLVGFALETGADDAVVAYARKKLHEKRVDLVVANRADEALGGESSRVAFVSEAGASWLPKAEKTQLSRAIVDAVKVAMDARRR